MMTWVLVGVALLGSAATVAGVVGIIRDGRRISALVYAVLGLGTMALAAGFLLFLQGHQGVLIALGVAALIAIVGGNLLGFPALVGFLLWSGVTILRRESRTLGNALALLAGIALVLLPSTLGFLAPPETVRHDAAYLIRYAVHLAVTLIVAYIACAFAAFLGASLLYRWRRSRAVPEAVIVLGARLITGQVPPLLAGRLQRALRAQREHRGAPTIITSGGQGPDESRAEGTAMREYLINQGADSHLVVAETESHSTAQNLRFSRKLLARPDAPVAVVTSSYHVFRAALLTRSLGMRAHVLGAPTAWYYIPSATLREFVGVMRDSRRIHLVSVALLVVFAGLITIILVPATAPPGA